MKAIKLNIVINSIRSRKDRSVGFSAETPELTNDERNVFFDLQGKNANILIEPEDGSNEVIKVDTDLQEKTQAQRIRAVLFVYWKQNGEKGDFKDFYYRATEKYINEIKSNLE
jgi:hypothetical protein